MEAVEDGEVSRDGNGSADIDGAVPIDGGYDPSQYARGILTSQTEKLDAEQDTDSDGSILNAKTHTFALELVLGSFDPKKKAQAGEHHGVQYGAIETFPFMNAEQTVIRFVCFGKFWSEEKAKWVENYYEVAIHGKRLHKIYTKILAGVRALVRVTGPIHDEKKSQVDRVVMAPADIEAREE